MRNLIAVLSIAVLALAALAAPAQAQATPGPTRYLVSATVCNEQGQPIEVGQMRDSVKEAQTLAVYIAGNGTWEEDQSGETEGTYWPSHRILRIRILPVGF